MIIFLCRAANAHMTGTYLADRHPNLKTSVINFGSPRIGNSAFKSWTETTLKNLSVWRFVFRRDIVPRIILRQLGYVHAGHLFMMYENNSKVYYHQVGNGWNYKGAPLSWYCEYYYKI
jgi:predicted lipase